MILLISRCISIDIVCFSIQNPTAAASSTEDDDIDPDEEPSEQPTVLKVKLFNKWTVLTIWINNAQFLHV